MSVISKWSLRAGLFPARQESAGTAEVVVQGRFRGRVDLSPATWSPPVFIPTTD